MMTLVRSFLFALVFAFPLLALDGKWTPEQVLQIDPAWLAEQGLKIPPQRLWDANRGTGLLAGTVSIAGCSGGFISSTGLIATNHHCLFSLIQEHSTPERDLITNGFLARSHAEELPGATTRVEIPRRFTDVTAVVTGAVPRKATDAQRLEAIEAKRKELVATCHKQPDVKCRVAEFENGLQYTLIETIELRDVRLVYAPPRAIGEYGGEIDNWMWPRHSGDFAIARAWVGPDGRPAARSEKNVPYRPEFFFPISQRGLSPGELVMVLGYPGITWRSFLAEEMSERRDRFFVRREELFGEWIRRIDGAAEGSAEGSIAVAANLKSIHNRYKNAQGQIAGLDRGRIVDRQREQDEAVVAWAMGRKEHAEALAARETLRQVLDERQRTWERDFLLNLIPMGVETVAGGIPPLPKGLYFGATIAHLARERQKPEAARATDFTEADVTRIRDRMEREAKNYFEPADKSIFRGLVMRALALPAEQRLPSVDRFFGGLSEEQISGRIDEMYAATALFDPQARAQMLSEGEETLAARKDMLLDFGRSWNSDLRSLRERERTWNARVSRSRPVWRRAVIAHAGKPVAPDANSTLRVSFGHVQGYQPRDAVTYKPFTTLAGAVEKHTGVEPFDLPEKVLSLREKGGRWTDPNLGDVAVNFLADGDTTGGNSGSPVVNGYGELVGLNFDRVWENVANDFGFNPAIARNVSVDIRFMLWMLENVDQATELLRELGIAQVE